MRRHPVIFAHRPVDPRSQPVLSSSRKGGFVALELGCGHTVRRRMRCTPERIICPQCPPASGFGSGSRRGV